MIAAIRLRPGFHGRVAWGKPDSPQRPLCAICAGALPEVPLRLWRDDGSGAAFCDHCVEEWFEVASS